MKIIQLKNMAWISIKKLANLNISIFIFLTIASISILGTVIEQEQNLQFYQKNYPINSNLAKIFNWQLINKIGLNHLYTTWWFLIILFLFFLSLMTCTLSTQMPSLNNARKWKFIKKSQNIKKSISKNKVNIKSINNIVNSLKNHNYYIFQKDKNIYAYKGLISKISPIFVHVSLIIVLTGALIGQITGFTAQEMIPCNEIFHIDNATKSGLLSNLPDNYLIETNKFLIIYNQDHSIKQFISQITVNNYKKDYITDTYIAVNKPLKLNGLTLYQTDWQINAIRIKIGKSCVLQKRLNKIRLQNQNLWVCNIPLSNSKYLIIVIKNLRDKPIIYTSSGNFIAEQKLNKHIIINETSFVIKEIMTSTGLQIKTDSGITIVYIGFALLMGSISLSYFSYSEIWVINNKKMLSLVGTTNRAIITFEEDISQIEKQYIQDNCSST